MIITIDGRPWMHWYYWRDISWCRIWTFFDIHEGEARTHCVSNRPILDVVRSCGFCINRMGNYILSRITLKKEIV